MKKKKMEKNPSNYALQWAKSTITLGLRFRTIFPYKLIYKVCTIKLIKKRIFLKNFKRDFWQKYKHFNNLVSKIIKDLMIMIILETQAQCVERNWNEIVNRFNEAFSGWKNMLQRFRVCFSWNPGLKGIGSIS